MSSTSRRKDEDHEESIGQTLPLRRSTRQRSKAVAEQYAEKDVIAPRPILSEDQSLAMWKIEELPSTLPSKLPGLTREGARLLHHKQSRLKDFSTLARQLRKCYSTKSSMWLASKRAVNATLVFAQEEAGTAVCISAEGLLLTCSHCVAETLEDLDMEALWWLILSGGTAVQAKTVKWDAKRDLALLQIVASQPLAPDLSYVASSSESLFTFPSVNLADAPPPLWTKFLCIGHPGSEDLEAERRGKPTGYDVLHISEGKFHGYAKGQNRQDNSEIGALMHDCWTYWGHSGAPLIERKNGELVGLHSSWDDETSMRRGIGMEALNEFVQEWKRSKE